jgi:hypothetical protein
MAFFEHALAIRPAHNGRCRPALERLRPPAAAAPDIEPADIKEHPIQSE